MRSSQKYIQYVTSIPNKAFSHIIYFNEIVGKSKIYSVRCPGYTIQFLNYGYSQYIRKVLELVEINPDKIECGLHPSD